MPGFPPSDSSRPSPLDRALRSALEARRAQGLLRAMADCQPAGCRVERAGRVLLNFSSNDYLGLSQHPAVRQAMSNAAQRWGTGAGASPLLTGHGPAHAAAEAALARWQQTEAALLLPSGYQAAHAIIQTLAALHGPLDIRFFLDKYAHACLLDAVRAGGRPWRTFRHNDVARLERLLADGGDMPVVVTESIYSMDGDAAPLTALAELKSRRPFVWVLDEAHGSGVYGPAGAGLAAELGLGASVDVHLATCSKAMGVSGGAICASADFCHAVANFGRALIYSTAVSPPVAAAVEAALAVMAAEPGRQARLRALARRVRADLAAAGWQVEHGDAPIVPLVIGPAPETLQVADSLLKQGILVGAIRPPTVPPGSSRLRISLSSQHADDDVDCLLRAVLATCRPPS